MEAAKIVPVLRIAGVEFGDPLGCIESILR